MTFAAYAIHLAILVCIYFILALGLNLAVGFTGLLNLGHIAFFGISAYATAILTTKGFPFWLGLLVGTILATIAGALLALPTSRLKGDYLALATLGFTFIMTAVSRNWQGLTRGALGIPGIPRIVVDNNQYLLIVFGLSVILLAIVIWLIKSPFGRTIQAIRDDEIGAMVLGKNVFYYRIASMSISAAIAGIAGFFFAHFITFIDPTIFGLEDLILLFSIIIVGGLASIRGTIIGTIILFLLPEPLRFIGFPSSVIGPARAILFSLILLIILIYRPKGFFGEVDLT